MRLGESGTMTRSWKMRRRTRPKRFTELSVGQILGWADSYHARMGRWPNVNSGHIPEGFGESWQSVDLDLRLGLRGLSRESSLARLLAEKRGVRNIKGLPPLTIQQILAWSDAHHKRTGQWPKRGSGAIQEARGETWMGIEGALFHGSRGLPGGSSLSALLAQQRRVRNHMRLARLTVRQILAWADAHHLRCGCWPRSNSGSIQGAPEETWLAVDVALEQGNRGLPGGSSLPRLLAEHRGVRNPGNLAHLTEEEILAWSDAFHARTGRWPTARSGTITEAPGETWMRVATALREGLRGLRGGSSLARLLERKRGVRNRLRSSVQVRS
jgi:hypothetical protein